MLRPRTPAWDRGDCKFTIKSVSPVSFSRLRPSIRTKEDTDHGQTDERRPVDP